MALKVHESPKVATPQVPAPDWQPTSAALTPSRFADLKRTIELEEVQILHENARAAESSQQFLAGQLQDALPLPLAQESLKQDYTHFQAPNQQERLRLEDLLDSYSTYDRRKKAQARNRVMALCLEMGFSLAVLNLIAYGTHKHLIPGYIEPLYFILLMIIPHALVINRVLKKYRVND